MRRFLEVWNIHPKWTSETTRCHAHISREDHLGYTTLAPYKKTTWFLTQQH